MVRFCNSRISRTCQTAYIGRAAQNSATRIRTANGSLCMASQTAYIASPANISALMVRRIDIRRRISGDAAHIGRISGNSSFRMRISNRCSVPDQAAHPSFPTDIAALMVRGIDPTVSRPYYSTHITPCSSNIPIRMRTCSNMRFSGVISEETIFSSHFTRSNNPTHVACAFNFSLRKGIDDSLVEDI